MPDKRVPIRLPVVNSRFDQMNALQRAAESMRYVLLRWELWASLDGALREWLRQNTRLGAQLLIPALFVMPVIGFILWQLTGWLALLTSIASRLIVLPILVLLALAMFRITTAFIKR